MPALAARPEDRPSPIPVVSAPLTRGLPSRPANRDCASDLRSLVTHRLGKPRLVAETGKMAVANLDTVLSALQSLAETRLLALDEIFGREAAWLASLPGLLAPKLNGQVVEPPAEILSPSADPVEEVEVARGKARGTVKGRGRGRKAAVAESEESVQGEAKVRVPEASSGKTRGSWLVIRWRQLVREDSLGCCLVGFCLSSLDCINNSSILPAGPLVDGTHSSPTDIAREL